MSCITARKAALSFGSIRYSAIARIGPRSSATRLRKQGDPPAHRRRQILRLVRLQLPRPCERETNQRPNAGAIEGERHALRRCDLAPHGAAKRKRAEVDSEENRQTPAAHPFWQRDLRRDKKRRQRDDRRRAVDEARDEREYGLARRGEETERGDGSDRAKRGLPVRAEPFLQPAERERRDDRADADSGHELAVDLRAAAALAARHQRQQGEIGAGEGKEGDGADERRIHFAAVANIAHAGRHRADQAFGRQRFLWPWRRPPPDQRRKQRQDCRRSSTRRERRC